MIKKQPKLNKLVNFLSLIGKPTARSTGTGERGWFPPKISRKARPAAPVAVTALPAGASAWPEKEAFRWQRKN